jgi:hypothetical protein
MKKKNDISKPTLIQNRALSIRQPHAEKFLRGIKTSETRGDAHTHSRACVYLCEYEASPKKNILMSLEQNLVIFQRGCW